MDHLQTILDNLPTKPGCYLMKDESGKIIYVGKAINLRSRVRSYFHSQVDSQKTVQLVKNIADIETIIVGSELEALILEMNLIKKHRPKYNVRLKDDKRYPYIKVHWHQPFPKVTVTRRMDQDGSRYFGPYTSVWAVQQTLDVLRKIFPYLTCDREITGNDPRACLYYDIKLCNAPCIGVVTKDEYRAVMDDLCRFLQGKTESVVKRLKAEMMKASDEMQYEKAASIRDQLVAIERVVEKQKVISTEQIDSDVIAVARANGDTCAQIFFIRAGKLIGRESFMLEGGEDEESAEIVSQFIKQFYDEAAYVPPEVVLPDDLPEVEIISQWLRDKRGGDKVTLTVPHRGEKRGLIELAAENASEALNRIRAQREADQSKHVEAMSELQTALRLPNPPTRIECFDISHTQGIAAVASMVVFTQGAPNKKHYRSFNIRTVQGVDDFASMREALRRRFRRWKDGQEVKEAKETKETGKEVETETREPVGRLVGQKVDESFAMLPDLLLIDGGKGQLSEAAQVLSEFGLSDRVPVASLAKQQEEIFLPGQSNSILLPRNSQGLFLVQRVRDEAHRFAITHHRDRRDKRGLVSALDSIPGIGPSRKRALRLKFGDVASIRNASIEEIMKVRGISRDVAKTIKEHLG
jgi:excinuclease ABC subunit C